MTRQTMPYRKEDHACHCGRPFLEEGFGEVPVSRCRNCEKTWVSLAGFSRLLKSVSDQDYCARLQPRGARSAMACGICQRRMRHLVFGDTTVDWCARHGYLFEDGQLSHVLANHQSWTWQETN